MERKEEYLFIMNELNNIPKALEFSVVHAKARARRKHAWNCFIIPVSSILSFLIIFVIMINLSSTFAMACGRVPLLRELTEVVNFSKSLKAAVENDYIQPIGLEQTKDNISIRIEYVIVDQKQLNIFYTLQIPENSNIDITPIIDNVDWTPLGNYCLNIKHSDRGFENGGLYLITAEFYESDMPDSLQLFIIIDDNYNMTTSGFSFQLKFNPEYTRQSEIITLNQDFIIDGQLITLADVEIYPSHVRLKFIEDEDNTAWLQSVSAYLENENGKRFIIAGNGINSFRSEKSNILSVYCLESPFFSQYENLSIYITNTSWLDKDMGLLKIDLANTKADILPEGVIFDKSTYKDGNWRLTFYAKKRYIKKNTPEVFETKYYDEAGNEYEYNGWSSNLTSYYDKITEEIISNIYKIELTLYEYPYDVVYIKPAYSHDVILEEPIIIKVGYAVDSK